MVAFTGTDRIRVPFTFEHHVGWTIDNERAGQQQDINRAALFVT
jgi:hypothetical protein